MVIKYFTLNKIYARKHDYLCTVMENIKIRHKLFLFCAFFF